MTSRAPRDLPAAVAFAQSWNRLPRGSVYTREQVVDWFQPLDLESIRGKEVLELGFGNGSLLYHVADFGPARLCGVELGDTLETTRRNLAHLPPGVLELHRGDLTQADLGRFDLVYCIGVLHHLKEPEAGFRAVLRNTRPGGRFHCWVYAREGNAIVRWLVDPLRKLTSRLPWWLTKYFAALPLAVPFFLYAKALALLSRPRGRASLASRMPLYEYARWISTRGFAFFHHVAFDQLVTPVTSYLPRATVDAWLRSPEIAPGSTYCRFRNGNSWSFGGALRGDR